MRARIEELCAATFLMALQSAAARRVEFSRTSWKKVKVGDDDVVRPVFLTQHLLKGNITGFLEMIVPFFTPETMAYSVLAYGMDLMRDTAAP